MRTLTLESLNATSCGQFSHRVQTSKSRRLVASCLIGLWYSRLNSRTSAVIRDVIPAHANPAQRCEVMHARTGRRVILRSARKNHGVRHTTTTHAVVGSSRSSTRASGRVTADPAKYRARTEAVHVDGSVRARPTRERADRESLACTPIGSQSAAHTRSQFDAVVLSRRRRSPRS